MHLRDDKLETTRGAPALPDGLASALGLILLLTSP